MNYILFDGPYREALLPLTFTRPVADIRIGILTIREKWERYLGFTITTVTEDYLTEKYPMVEMEQNILINASVLPNENLVEKITSLKENQALVKDDEIIAFYSLENQEDLDIDNFDKIAYGEHLLMIKNTWDLFNYNGHVIKTDFELITAERFSEPIPDNSKYLNKDNIFIEKGASINFAILNASEGPIYIGENVEIMEGAMIRGPIAICDNAVVKMGAKLYTSSTIGPGCKVGGELNNVIMFENSNKAHDGFLGNSVIGEWCNLGADTNNSNLKNTYEQVRLWNYETENFAKTGLQFCGLIMGDHSKTAINTMLNTGTVIGVSSNVYGSNFPRNFIPSFSWGGASGLSEYNFNKAVKTAKAVFERRGKVFDEIEENIFRNIFESTKKYR